MSIVIFIDDWRLGQGLDKIEPSVHHYMNRVGFFCVDLSRHTMEVA